MRLYPLIFVLLALFSTYVLCSNGSSGGSTAEQIKEDLKKASDDMLKGADVTAKDFYNNRKEYANKLQAIKEKYKGDPQLLYEELGIDGLMGQKSTNFPLGVGLMAVGAVLAFFGRKMFRVFLALSGFIAVGSLFLYAVVWTESLMFTKDNPAPAWLFWTAGVIGGLLGSFLFIRAWKFGVYILSAYAGVMVSIFVFGVLGEHLQGVNRTSVHVVFAVIGCICAHFIEEIVLIVASSLMGAFVMVIGLDCMAAVGYRGFVKSHIIDKSQLSLQDIWLHSQNDTNTLVCTIVVLSLTIAGVYVQFRNRKNSTDLN